MTSSGSPPALTSSPTSAPSPTLPTSLNATTASLENVPIPSCTIPTNPIDRYASIGSLPSLSLPEPEEYDDPHVSLSPITRTLTVKRRTLIHGHGLGHGVLEIALERVEWVLPDPLAANGRRGGVQLLAHALGVDPPDDNSELGAEDDSPKTERGMPHEFVCRYKDGWMPLSHQIGFTIDDPDRFVKALEGVGMSVRRRAMEVVYPGIVKLGESQRREEERRRKWAGKGDEGDV